MQYGVYKASLYTERANDTIRYAILILYYSALKSWHSQFNLSHCTKNWKNNGKKLETEKKTKINLRSTGISQQTLESV